MRWFNLILIIFLVNTFYLYSKDIIIESEGYSIIKEDLNSSREDAIKDAINKGIKKFLHSKNIKANDEFIDKIRDSLINGYEIEQEVIEGNILREKIKILFDETTLSDLFKKKTIIPIDIGIAVYLNENFDDELAEYLKTLISNSFDYNFTFFKIKKDNSSYKDYRVVIISDIILNKIKELYSINKIFYKISAKINIYVDGSKIDNISIEKDLILSKNKDYKKDISQLLLNNIQKTFDDILKRVKNTKSNNKNLILYFTLVNPKGFSIIDTLENIFEEFNIEYTPFLIYKKSITYKIKGVSEKEIISILRAKNFYYNFKISPNGENEGGEHE